MRKVKLQMQLSLDGFVCGPNDEMDWMTWEWDEELKQYVSAITDASDTILMGRKMASGFMEHWTQVSTLPEDEGYEFAKKMLDIPKVVFSNTLKSTNWVNTKVTSNMVTEIDHLKKQEGKDIIVYGGASLASSLLKQGLIDELILFINPAAIGKGKAILQELSTPQPLKLLHSIAFPCGIVLLKYAWKKE